MAQNVSSVRVAIQGDARGLNAELMKASKAVSDFGGRTNRSSVQGLDAQLASVRRAATEIAEQYVTGGKVQRTELLKLIELEKRLQRQIEARNTALSAARGTLAPLPEAGVAGGSTSLQSLSRQMTDVQRKGPNVNFIIGQLGFAAEDAAISFGTMGLAGALRGASNNLSVVAMQFGVVPGIIVGVGSALAASLIPMLTRTKSEMDEGRRAAERMADSLKRLSISSINARGLIMRSVSGPLSVEGVTSAMPDRFASQRTDFNSRLIGERLSKEQADRIASVETSLFSGAFFDKSVIPSGSSLEGIERGKEIREQFQYFMETSERRMRRAYEESIAKGDVSKIIQAQGELLSNLRINGAPEGLLVEEFSEEIRNQSVALVDLAGEAIVASKNITELESALERLGKNESISKGTQSIVDALNPVFQVGGRFGDRFQALSNAFSNEFGGAGVADKMKAFREADPLQAGYQFGSIEAVSAINRATFARPNDTEKDIEKNTSETVTAVRDVTREVKNMGSAVTRAIKDTIKVGTGL